MEDTKLSAWECFSIVLTIVIAHTVLSLPRTLLNTTKSGTIINMIYVSVIVLALVYLICRIFQHFPGCDLLDISEYVGGRLLKNVIGTAFICYFFISSSILLRNFCESIKVIYYPMTDVSFVILFFVIAVTIVNRFSFNASFRTNLLILPLAVITILFLFFANLKNFSLDRMFPILGDGVFNTFVTGIGNISAFAGIATIYFLPPLLKEPQKFKKIALSSVLASTIYAFIAVVTLQLMFRFFISNSEIIPLYSATRYIEFGSFFQRLESVFLLIWMSLFACYLCIANKFSMIIFKKLTNIKYLYPLIYPFSLLTFSIALIPKNYAESQFFENTIFRYFAWFFVFTLCIGIFLIAYIKKKISTKRKEV